MKSLVILVTTTLLLAISMRPTYAGDHPKQGLADMLFEYLSLRYLNIPLRKGDLLYVSIHRQRMYYIEDGKMKEEFIISTAKEGLGGRQDSYRTPTGLMRISEKIGAEVPIYGILESREFTGKVANVKDPINAKQDHITSRILWLEGMEPGSNRGGYVDTHDRFIYIHGTADEASLGTPSSMGCVRMKNADIIRLFRELAVGTHVVVLDN